MGYDPNQCPIATEFFYKREMNLPMHPRLTEQNIKDMVDGIRTPPPSSASVTAKPE